MMSRVVRTETASLIRWLCMELDPTSNQTSNHRPWVGGRSHISDSPDKSLTPPGTHVCVHISWRANIVNDTVARVWQAKTKFCAL